MKVSDSAIEGLSTTLATAIDLANRTLYLFGGIDDSAAFRFITGFRLLDSTKGPIRVIMSSGGGSESAGFTIYDALTMAHNPVTIDCYGAVMSIAVLILQGGTRRRLSNECRFMVHHGHISIGEDVHQATIMAIGAEARRNSDRYAAILATRSTLSFDQVMTMVDKETYLSAQDCIRAGFADEVITRKSVELPLPKAKPKKKPPSIVNVVIDPSSVVEPAPVKRRKRTPRK